MKLVGMTFKRSDCAECSSALLALPDRRRGGVQCGQGAARGRQCHAAQSRGNTPRGVRDGAAPAVPGNEPRGERAERTPTEVL